MSSQPSITIQTPYSFNKPSTCTNTLTFSLTPHSTPLPTHSSSHILLHNSFSNCTLPIQCVPMRWIFKKHYCSITILSCRTSSKWRRAWQRKNLMHGWTQAEWTKALHRLYNRVYIILQYNSIHLNNTSLIFCRKYICIRRIVGRRSVGDIPVQECSQCMHTRL